MTNSTDQKRGPLERLLGLFTEVRGGESRSALLLTLNIFLILTAYYIIKPVREALILSNEGGAEIKSYAAAGQAVLLLGLVPLYARLASTVSRRKLINIVNLFFMSNLVLFYLVAQIPSIRGQLGLVFFLWVGIFNLMVPALFWSLANDVYSTDQGKRLFVIVAFGASMGAVVGSGVTEVLQNTLGVYQLLLLSAAILGLALFLSNTVEHTESERLRQRSSEKAYEAEEPMSKDDAFKLVWRKRYLLLIALLMLFLNWVNTTGEYILGRVIGDLAQSEAAAQGLGTSAAESFKQQMIVGFYAGFYKYVNITGVVIQLLLVSRIIKYLGIRIALLFLPVIAFAGYGLMAFVPVLAIIRISKIAENATDYSLQNTVRQALFLPTTREEKYKAKQAIDTFFVRSGDVLSAVLVYIGVNQLALSTKGFALVNVGLSLVWLGLAVAIGRRYKALTQAPAA